MILDRTYKARQRALLEAHFDANETMFLERELVQLRQKIFEVQFPDPVARMFLPKATDIASSAEIYAYKVYRPVGNAAVINYKSDDIPRVDMVADEVQGKVRPIAAAYGWDINELREAARLGLQLSETKARTARDAIERGIDELLAFGTVADAASNRADIGLSGLVNNSLIAGSANANVLDGSYWTDATDPADMLADLNSLVVAPSNASKNVFRANALILPLSHYNRASQTPWSALTGQSVLEVFKQNNKQISSILPWHKLDSVTTAQGGADKPRAIAYQKGPDTGEAVIPQEFEQMPPEMKALTFVINCHARCGGVKIYQPLAFKYLDFATS